MGVYKKREYKKIEQVVDEIHAVCEKDEDGHLIYKGKHSDVTYIPGKGYNGKTHSLPKILFSYLNKIPIENISQLQKFCHKSLCVEPTHFCTKTEMYEAEKDDNGFTAMQRTSFLYKLKLLPKPYNAEDCILFTDSIDKSGYGNLANGVNSSTGAHILSLRLKIGRPLAPNMQASHICNQRNCVNPFHLVEETVAQNCRRKKECKLNQTQVMEIYKLKGFLGQRKIAAKFNVAKNTIKSIHTGITYSDITGEIDSKKVKRSDFKITQEMRDDLKLYLETNCKHEIDDITGETHIIPKKEKRNRDGYAGGSKWGYGTTYHTLAAIVKYQLQHFPNMQKDEMILHACKRRDCCAYDHISIGTNKQNSDDKKRDGTNRNHGTITKELADQIRTEKTGNHTDIARKFNVSRGIVQQVRRNVSWNDDESLQPRKKKTRTS